MRINKNNDYFELNVNNYNLREHLNYIIYYSNNSFIKYNTTNVYILLSKQFFNSSCNS